MNKRLQFVNWKPWSIEIVDLDSYKMVMFHGYVNVYIPVEWRLMVINDGDEWWLMMVNDGDEWWLKMVNDG